MKWMTMILLLVAMVLPACGALQHLARTEIQPTLDSINARIAAGENADVVADEELAALKDRIELVTPAMIDAATQAAADAAAAKIAEATGGNLTGSDLGDNSLIAAFVGAVMLWLRSKVQGKTVLMDLIKGPKVE